MLIHARKGEGRDLLGHVHDRDLDHLTLLPTLHRKVKPRAALSLHPPIHVSAREKKSSQKGEFFQKTRFERLARNGHTSNSVPAQSVASHTLQRGSQKCVSEFDKTTTQLGSGSVGCGSLWCGVLRVSLRQRGPALNRRITSRGNCPQALVKVDFYL